MTNYQLSFSLLIAASLVAKSACQFGYGGFGGYGNFPSCGVSSPSILFRNPPQTLTSINKVVMYEQLGRKLHVDQWGELFLQ
jgi:hypothetical protein